MADVLVQAASDDLDKERNNKRSSLDLVDPSCPKKAKTSYDNESEENENLNKYNLIQKQIEYYFSDKNLSRDYFFHKKISENDEGWLDTKLLLRCNKIKSLKASQDDIARALKSSQLETKIDANDELWVRRTTPLPLLKNTTKTKNKNNEVSNNIMSMPTSVSVIHALGCMLKLSEIPVEISWGKLKEAFIKELATHKIEQAKILQVTNPDAEGVAFIHVKKFPDDKQVLENLTCLTIDNVKIPVALVNDLGTAKSAIQALPKIILRYRQKEFIKLKSEHKKTPLSISGKRFDSLDHLRKCYRELLETTAEGEPLKEPFDQVIREILNYHPRAEEKTRDIKRIFVGVRRDLQGNESQKGKEIKCFFVERLDGSVEDFSIVKCINVMMENGAAK